LFLGVGPDFFLGFALAILVTLRLFYFLLLFSSVVGHSSLLTFYGLFELQS